MSSPAENSPNPTAEETPKKNSKEPRYTRLTQQELPACKPVLEPIWVFFIFLAVACVCIPIGAVTLVYGLKAKEVSQRYDQTCINVPSNKDRIDYIWANAGNDAALSCQVTLTLLDDMPAPVMVYYELSGYYQNHRRYVGSANPSQLAGLTELTNECAPEEYYGGNKTLPINPCGLIAWSYFNDTYDMTVTSREGAPIANIPLVIDDNDLSLPTDTKYRFGDYTPQNFNPLLNSYRGGGNISTTPKQDQRFQVWMRVSTLPRFRKLWGKIYTDLKKGDTVTVNVINRYNTYSFDGEKSIVLGTTTWLGGRNPFLGIAFVSTGGLSVILALLYGGLRLLYPRKFGDVSALSFN